MQYKNMEQNLTKLNNVTKIVCAIIAGGHSIEPKDIVSVAIGIYDKVEKGINDYIPPKLTIVDDEQDPVA